MIGSQRGEMLATLSDAEVDVAIVGGGINGAVIAAALTGAGVRTALLDKGDFSSFTSQESSNLIWGGFKYLQTYELGLVRKLCQARNRLTDAYPTQVQPIEFLATFDDDSPYPAWLAGMGAMAYWAIGNFATARPRVLKAADIESLEPCVNTERAKGGLVYADAYLPDNDARFAFGFIRDSIGRGLIAANYTEATNFEFRDERWIIDTTDTLDHSTRTFSASAVINATGPWVDRINERLDVDTHHRIALSKGIHLVVPRIGSGDRVLAFFDEDERLYYVIPMGDRSVIGTTDTRVDRPQTVVTAEDRAFVLRQINARLDLATPLTSDDIIGERCGVRPLVVEAGDDDASTDWLQLSRKHEIETDRSRRVISVFGGKLTDCLNVGEEVLEAIGNLGVGHRELGDDWFGEPSSSERSKFDALAARLETLTDDDTESLWRRYGHRARAVLQRIVDDPSLGQPIWDEPRYLRAEVVEIGDREMVATIEDFLRRRTGLSLVERQPELDEREDEFARLLDL